MIETTNTFSELSNSEDPVVAILATLVVILASVVVYQWFYTSRKTVPKWLWDETMRDVTGNMKLLREDHVELKSIKTIIDERIKK